jgi:hypothetical protein
MMNPCKILLKKHSNPKGVREEQNKKDQNTKNVVHSQVPSMGIPKKVYSH